MKEEMYVDSSELLPSLKEDSSQDTETIVPRAVPEAIEVGSLTD